MNPEPLTVQNKKGHPLAANLYLPLDQAPRFYALFIHCFSQATSFLAVTQICRSLSLQGIAVFSVDFAGLGRENEAVPTSSFSAIISDLSDVVTFLEQHHEAPKMLIGHSLGGTVSLHLAELIDSVQAIATIATPAFPAHFSQVYHENFQEQSDKHQESVSADLDQRPIAQVFKNLRKPLLIFHAPQDQLVGIENAAKIYKAAFHPKSFISLDGADHFLSNPADSHYIGEVISTWSIRYVAISENAKQNDLKGNQVLIRLAGEGFTTEIKTPHHHLLADEPIEVGGANLGPTPYDLLMASLGSCTAMTLKMYAERKGWPLTEVQVYLNHDKVHLDDSKASEDPGAKVSQFTRIIELEGDLDDDQRQKLLEISNRCPVHRTLQEEIKIRTMLAK